MRKIVVNRVAFVIVTARRIAEMARYGHVVVLSVIGHVRILANSLSV